MGQVGKKLPAWDFSKVKPMSEAVEQAKKDGRSVHFASRMDLCHLKHSNLEKHLQTYKGRVVFLGGQRQRRQWIQCSNHGGRSFTLANGSSKVFGSVEELAKPTRQFPLKRRGTCRRHHDYCDCPRRSARKCGQDFHPIEDRNNWTRLMNQWFS